MRSTYGRSGDGEQTPRKGDPLQMRSFLKYLVPLTGALAVAATVAGFASSTPSKAVKGSASAPGITGYYNNGTPQKGGTWRVGVEQSFGFTNNFDPTGEYLGTGINIYENL